jgi:aryl-alcohol dehydrogenase-like predicted oxidoreductase
MAQKPWIVAIPGTRNLDHSRENLGSINVQLTPEDLLRMETAFSRIVVQGGRMNATQMAQIGKD